MTAPLLPPLSLIETRVLGVLSEKQHTVPDTYPLSLNALVAGCSQKTSRHPVIDVTEAEVLAAIERLRGPALVIESSGGRVTRYAHNMEKALRLPSQSTALLTALMLRGPQTSAELRTHCERMHRFADISAVEGFLQELAERADGALVVKLPRLPGSRENRWAHLLSGDPLVDAVPAAASPAFDAGATGSDIGRLASDVARLQTEVDALKERVAVLCEKLGVTE